MFIRRLRLGSLSWAVTGTPPRDRAITAPPARSCELLCQEAISMVPITISEVQTTICGYSRSAYSGSPTKPTVTTRLMTSVTSRKARMKPTTSQRV